jgi:hypothetical protein
METSPAMFLIRLLREGYIGKVGNDKAKKAQVLFVILEEF